MKYPAIASLEVRRRLRKQAERRDGRKVVAVVNFRLVQRCKGQVHALGKLPQVALLETPDGNCMVCPSDRARAWQSLAAWVEHLLVFPHPAVVEGQYQNRLKWESWAHAGKGRPAHDALYDWQADEGVLEALRPAHRRLRARLEQAVGRPRLADLGALYPNRYDDLGFSDAARKAICELKAVFGADVFAD